MFGPHASRPRLLVVSAIGVAQILAFGASYYLPAIIAAPVAADTGWPLPWVVGALSLGLLVSGLVSPAIGRLIERSGGRRVLAGSAVLMAAGLALLAGAPSLPMFLAAWLVMGLAMGAGLYDPAFAALGRLYGDQARGAITQVTLYGGFASTVCWPLSAFLVAQVGWRGTCLAYALIALTVMLPLYLIGLPQEAPRPPALPAAEAAAPAPSPCGRRSALIVFAMIMTLSSVVTTVVSVHLITLVQARGLDLAAAVGLGMLIGPAQVGARVIEATFGRHHHPLWSLLVSMVAVSAGLAMLMGGAGVMAAGLVLYGGGNGVRSIARGTVPLALFGREGYAALMGQLAAPALLAQAASPAIGTVLIAQVGPVATTLLLCAAAGINIALCLVLLAIAPVKRIGAAPPRP
ncbi:MFS transporter [Rhodovastum atsumiense]|uniref:MFS transporter n=1 Tax=Rhodovastum atsumiense TaxID=504468 RepID=A0A5M6IR09_9PROT|nr:MFS transporter [Rhodovastum atsumiense]KAA5610730.1 MFS transporter [Rhodovastum atsumiense]CAH2604353.1 MFS transporter [Rhodovastum atsumiense]